MNLKNVIWKQVGIVFSASRISHKAIYKKSNFDFGFHYPEYKKKLEGEKKLERQSH